MLKYTRIATLLNFDVLTPRAMSSHKKIMKYESQGSPEIGNISTGLLVLWFTSKSVEIDSCSFDLPDYSLILLKL